MGNSMNTMKKAVECGHWPLYRFDPRLIAEGKNPLQLDSKKIKIDYNDFIMSETRFKSLKALYPERADVLYKKAEEADKQQFEHLKKLSEL